MASKNTTLSTVISNLISIMKDVGKISSLSGIQKKQLVIDTLKKEIKLDNEVEDMILIIIDLLINIEKGKLTINPKAVSTFNTLFKCCKRIR